MRPFPGTYIVGLLIFLAAVSGCGSTQAGSGSGTDNAEAQLKFGVQMARQELWSEALFRFHRAAKLDPRNPRVFNNLAVASEATGSFEEALEYYREALKLDPNNRTLRGNYSRFVEFYRSFKPEEENPEGASAEAGQGEGGVSSAESSSR
jgi:Tfp pilus assembly protein PilF